eukprot:g83122.t1
MRLGCARSCSSLTPVHSHKISDSCGARRSQNMSMNSVALGITAFLFSCIVLAFLFSIFLFKQQPVPKKKEKVEQWLLSEQIFVCVVQGAFGLAYPLVTDAYQCQLTAKGALFCLLLVIILWRMSRLRLSSQALNWPALASLFAAGALGGCALVVLFATEAAVPAGPNCCVLSVPLYLAVVLAVLDLTSSATLNWSLAGAQNSKGEREVAGVSIEVAWLSSVGTGASSFSYFVILAVATRLDLDDLRMWSAMVSVAVSALYGVVSAWHCQLLSTASRRLEKGSNDVPSTDEIEKTTLELDRGPVVLPGRLSVISCNMQTCLRLVLDNPEARAAFRQYLQDTYADENLHFWMEAEALKMASPAELAAKADQVYERYMAPSAESEINISDKERPNFEVRKDINLFMQAILKAQDTVFKLLTEGSFKDFIMSERGKQLYEKIGAQPSTDSSLPKTDQEWLQHLAEIVSTLPFSVCVADMMQAGRPIIFVNEEFTGLTGYTNRDCVGRNCKFLQGEATDQKVVDEIRRALNDGRPLDIAISNYTKSGRLFQNFLALVPVFQTNKPLEKKLLPQFCCLCKTDRVKTRYHCVCNHAAYCSSHCMEQDQSRHLSQDCPGRPPVRFYMSVQFDSSASAKEGRLDVDLLLLEGIVNMLPNTITLAKANNTQAPDLATAPQSPPTESKRLLPIRPKVHTAHGRNRSIDTSIVSVNNTPRKAGLASDRRASRNSGRSSTPLVLEPQQNQFELGPVSPVCDEQASVPVKQTATRSSSYHLHEASSNTVPAAVSSAVRSHTHSAMPSRHAAGQIVQTVRSRSMRHLGGCRYILALLWDRTRQRRQWHCGCSFHTGSGRSPCGCQTHRQLAPLF